MLAGAEATKLRRTDGMKDGMDGLCALRNNSNRNDEKIANNEKHGKRSDDD